MIIVHIVECFAGGTVQTIQYITRYLPQHQHVVVHGARPEDEDPASVRARFPDYVKFVEWEHVKRSISPTQDWKALQSLLAILKERRFDVVHVHSSKAGFLGRFACRLLGFHNVWYTPHAVAFNQLGISGPKKVFLKGLERLASRFSGQVVPCSVSEQEALQAAGIPTVAAIPNGIALKGQILAQPGQRDRLRIVTCARVSQQKNPAWFQAIAAAVPEADFIWVGDGALKTQLKAPNIHLTGWQQAAEVQEHLQKADIYLSTSLWEGLPFGVMEAMAHGLPLLLSRCTGNVDLVPKGENGALYDTPEEAIRIVKKWMAQPSMLSPMGQASRHLLETQFTAQGMAQAYERLYFSGLTL